jgi:hypothetical protein
MDPRVEPGEVLARSLAHWRAYWHGQGSLTKAQERWREHEFEWRTNLAAEGLLLADSLAADIRSGAKERRDEQNMQNLLRDRARLARLKSEGHSFPPREKVGTTIELKGAPAWVETAFKRRAAFELAVSSRQAVVHVPERREPVATPRERRAPRRRAGSSRASPSDPSEEPDLAVIPLAAFRRELGLALGGPA